MLELSKRDLQTYSITNVISSMMHRGQAGLSGIEKEVHDELQKDHTERSAGCLVPGDIFQLNGRPRQKRDLNVNTFGQGGAFVQTTVSADYIPVLRNKLCCQRLGTRVMTDLVGNVALPRQTAAATAYALPEQTTLTKSTQVLDQVVMTPHRVGAFTSYSRQLVLQSSVSVEDFLRDDLNKVVATKWDSMILQGQGASSEPTGILNTTGIGTLSFGATPTWAQIVSFEQSLAAANADEGRLGWVVSPATKNSLKAVAKTGKGVTSVVPVMIWPEVSPFSDGSNDGVMNGYRAAATNQVLNNTVFFGNWADCILGVFGGIEIISDPYTQATDATVRVTINTFIDVAVRHAASFCVSTDSGAQ